jgi:magnesium-transporting ATPase (P-type)
MDILGAIAIGTEPFQQNQTRSKRISRRDQILTPWMWRQILGQSLYQIIVMIFLMYFGGLVFFTESFNLITTDDQDTKRKTLNTICFHSFILMNLFNSINCRIVDTKEATELNIFKTLFNNLTFWIVLGIEVFIQHMMLNSGEWLPFLSAIFGTVKLTEGQNYTCWTLGALSLVVNLAIKQIPIDYFAFTG